jgi:GR25 family glycosyltransferase involved in LPS biosynthesis
MKIDKVYIITIEHSEEHYNSLIERLDQLKLPDGIPFQIWSGVEGRELFKTEEGRKDYGIKFYDKWNIGGNWWGRDVTTGEAGGICSHVEVWEDAYEKGYQNVLIIEDDFEPGRCN